MCRMIMLWGDIARDFQPVFMSLSDVAQNDPLLLKDNKRKGHGDGWGFFSASRDSIKLGRFATPLTFNEHLPDIKSGITLVHARAAATGEGMGALNAHPFHEQDENYDVYISHNGWFDKNEMNKLLELETVKTMNDTEVFLRLVMSQSGSIESRVSSALELARKNDYMKGGANIYVVALKKGSSKASVIFHSDINQDREYSEYNILYSMKGRNWKGVTSSSVKLSQYFPKDVETERAERGRIYTEEIELS